MINNKLVVIPTYNEAKTIENLISAILRVYPETDILVVDDNSPDKTGAIAEKLAKRDARVRCLHRPFKDGIGPAYIEAYKLAMEDGYEYFVQMDADFSHDPKYIPDLFNLIKDHDLVIGSRYTKGGGVKNWSMGRRLLSKLGSFYAKLMLGLPVDDPTSGFKCFRRKVLEEIRLDSIISKGYVFQIETTFKAYKKGYRIKELPIVFPDRRVGKTKMSWYIFFEAIVNVWKMWKNVRQNRPVLL